MGLVMDKALLATFLVEQFPQVADEFFVDAVSETSLTLRLVPDGKHLRPGGTISGPTMFGLADVAVYLAILSKIGPKALAVTTNCSIDFMRKPVSNANLICTARVLKMGKRLAVGDAMLFSEGASDPVARASLTYAIPPR